MGKSQGDEEPTKLRGRKGRALGIRRGTGTLERQEEKQRCGNNLQLHPQLLSREAELQSQGKGGRPDVNTVQLLEKPRFLKALNPVGEFSV